MSKEIIIVEKHSLILRLTHWINVVYLSLMIWSGVLIYWANDIYIKIPNRIAEAFSIQYKLAEGLSWHFFIMWGFLINGLVYLAYQFISGEWKQLAPDKDIFRDAFFVMLHELHLKSLPPVMKGKFNAAQKLAYIGAILLAFGSLVTGIAIYKPVTMGWLTTLLGGYEAARLEHFILMLSFVLFIIIHIVQVIKAGWNNLRAMLAGYEIEKE
jgi:thiosulfate reductase cytochrome b subunit